MNFKFLKVFLSALLVIACVLPGFSSTASASENGVMKFDDGVTAKLSLIMLKKKLSKQTMVKTSIGLLLIKNQKNS